MEVYHKITPVRSIQQSINLIRSLKNEQKEDLDKTRPKSVVYTAQSFSDNYGQIPNLRDSVDKNGVFFPIRKQLKIIDRQNKNSSPKSKSGASLSGAKYRTVSKSNPHGMTHSSWERVHQGDTSMAE